MSFSCCFTKRMNWKNRLRLCRAVIWVPLWLKFPVRSLPSRSVASVSSCEIHCPVQSGPIFLPKTFFCHFSLSFLLLPSRRLR